MINFNKYLKIFRIIILILTLCICNVNAIGTAPNPVNTLSYYTFDTTDTSGTTMFDTTPNNNDGTCTGMTNCNTVTGKLNEASEFDGNNDYIQINQQLTRTGSASVWAKFDDTSVQQLILGHRSANANPDRWLLYNAGTDVLFNMGTVPITATGEASTTEYKHYVITWDEGSHEIFVNGVSKATGTYTPFDFSTFWTIGANKYTDLSYTGSYFDGKIDEVAIFNYVINQNEIDYLYQTGTPTSDQQWDFTSTTSTPTITFTNISVNNETFVNNSYYNITDLIFNITLETFNTNNNTNITYLFDGWEASNFQFATNNLTGILNLTPDYFGGNPFIRFASFNNNDEPMINGKRIAYNSTFPKSDTELAFCNQTLGSSFAIGGTSQVFNEDVYYWNGTDFFEVLNVSITDVIDTTDCEILGENKVYNISFYAFNNETNVSSGDLTFTIDTNKPDIEQINNISQDSFSINFSEVFAATDSLSGVATCSINITELSNVSIEDNFFINCTDTQVFSTVGFHNALVIATDNAGNVETYSLNFTINPLIYVRFYDFLKDINVTDYQVRVYHPDGRIELKTDINGTIVLSPVNDGELDLGLHTLEFIKTSYVEQNFTKLINDTNAGENISYNVNPSILTILIKDIDTGDLISPNNFTILVNNIDTGDSQEFNIINNNTLEVNNTFDVLTNFAISVIQNETIISSVAVVNPRKNVNISMYITDKETSIRQFEVLNPSLSVIPNSYVYLYIYIEGEGFVLQSQTKTNGVGQISFAIVEKTKTYNVCNTFNSKEKCLTQVIFIDPLTDPYQIIHDQDLTSNEKNVLDFISWSYIENKTNTTSEMTLIFDDAQRIVTSFCMNVTRTTNNVGVEELGTFCVDSYAGNVVQTFGLIEKQYLEYTFQYTYENTTSLLTKVRSYFDVLDITQLKSQGIFDLLFIFIYFGVLSLLLRFVDFEIYTLGLLVVMLIIFIIQSVISEDYIKLGIWGFMLVKSVALYSVRYGD